MDKELTIANGYFISYRRSRTKKIVYVDIFNCNEHRPIVTIPISLKYKSVFYFKNADDAVGFIKCIATAVAKYCYYEEEKDNGTENNTGIDA